MPEYIEREAATKAVMAAKWEIGSDAAMAMQIVATAPAADVAPVVHGRWIPVDGGQHKCSRCHTVRKTDVARDHYCPNCGAKMDGGVTDGSQD